MANKKKTTVPENVEETDQSVIDQIDPKLLDDARKNMRKQLTEKFGEWITVYDEDATDDDITAARKEFEDELAKYTALKFKMADADKAVEMAEFIRDWNANYNHWEKGAWRGVVQLDRVMTETIQQLKENNADFEIDYQTLMFLYKSMQNPNGFGIESAKRMAELEHYDVVSGKVIEGHEDEMTYSKVVEAIFKNTNFLQLADKMLKLRQERINLAAAGIKYDFKISELEEFANMYEAWVVTGHQQDNTSNMN